MPATCWSSSMTATTAPRWRRRMRRWPANEATLANLDATRRLQEAMIAQARGRARCGRGRGRARTVRRRALPRAGLGPVRLAAALPAGRCRRQEGACRRCQGARRRSPRRERRLDVIDTQKQQAQAALAAGHCRARPRAAQPRLHRAARADRRHRRQPQRANGRLRHGRARSCISLVPARGLWVDANFKESQLAAHAPRACRRRSRPTCCRAEVFAATSPAWRRRPAPSSACCRPRTRPATSPRSCSGCRCASCSTATLAARPAASRPLGHRRASTSASAEPR